MAGKRKKDETAGGDVPRKKLVSEAVPASEDADFPRGMSHFVSYYWN